MSSELHRRYLQPSLSLHQWAPPKLLFHLLPQAPFLLHRRSALPAPRPQQVNQDLISESIKRSVLPSGVQQGEWLAQRAVSSKITSHNAQCSTFFLSRPTRGVHLLRQVSRANSNPTLWNAAMKMHAVLLIIYWLQVFSPGCRHHCLLPCLRLRP